MWRTIPVVKTMVVPDPGLFLFYYHYEHECIFEYDWEQHYLRVMEKADA